MRERILNIVSPFFLGGLILYYAFFPSCDTIGKSASSSWMFAETLLDAIRTLFCENGLIQGGGILLGILILLVAFRNLIKLL